MKLYQTMPAAPRPTGCKFAYLQEGSAPAGPYISTAGYQVPASGLKGGPQYFSTHELGHSDVKAG